MTLVVSTVEAWRAANGSSGSLGLVPTMGALHGGHTSLIERSLADNDRTVVSVFVNPTQFDDISDLERYPRSLDTDLGVLESLGVDFAFTPSVAEMYPDDSRYTISESDLSHQLCGSQRPGHFSGVLNVVARLFNVMRPDRAYFGEKDYQQCLLIQGLVEALFLDVEIVPCATVRESDGLALSSRNRLLSDSARARAPRLYEALTSGASVDDIRRGLEEQGFDVQYMEERCGRRFAAVVLDGVRLIDNVPMSPTS